MAARIGFARLRSNKAVTITAAQYDPNVHRGDVVCPDVRCACGLVGVQATTRNIKGEQVDVDPFFRLTSSAEKTGRGHVATCRYNVERTVERLVARSREIKKLDENAEPLLAAAGSKKADFRLHILMELLPTLRQGSGPFSSNYWVPRASS